MNTDYLIHMNGKLLFNINSCQSQDNMLHQLSLNSWGGALVIGWPNRKNLEPIKLVEKYRKTPGYPTYEGLVQGGVPTTKSVYNSHQL